MGAKMCDDAWLIVFHNGLSLCWFNIFAFRSEVSFYNNALEAVKRGRSKLVAANVPYKRPEDFLCEMVKTDAHMDKVLIDSVSGCRCMVF